MGRLNHERVKGNSGNLSGIAEPKCFAAVLSVVSLEGRVGMLRGRFLLVSVKGKRVPAVRRNSSPET
jgi:hypothetical protein